MDRFFGAARRLCDSSAVAISRELPSNLALLVLRAVVGINVACLHGWDKLHHYGSQVGAFPDPLGMGHKYSLILAIAGEFAGGILLATGLVGRAAAFILSFVVALTLFSGLHGTSWREREVWMLYFAASLTILLLGCGRYALDSVVWKRFGKGGGKGASQPPKR